MLLFQWRNGSRVEPSSSVSASSSKHLRHAPLPEILAANGMTALMKTFEDAMIFSSQDVAALSVTELQQFMPETPLGQIVRLRRSCQEAAAGTHARPQSVKRRFQAKMCSTGMIEGSLREHMLVNDEVLIVVTTLFISIAIGMLYDQQPVCADGSDCTLLRMADTINLMLCVSCYFFTVSLVLVKIIFMQSLSAGELVGFLEQHWNLAMMPISVYAIGNHFFCFAFATHLLIKLPASLASLTWVVVTVVVTSLSLIWCFMLALFKRVLRLRWSEMLPAWFGFMGLY